MSAALEFSAVTLRFGSRVAVNAVSLDIAAGEVLCLLGPSGCGKTTALRLAAGLERPDSGEIHVAGRRVAGPTEFVPPERRGVGLLFQDYALFPHLTVEANVGFGLAQRPAAERDSLARRWLERVGLWHRRATFPHELSGGEQQRVALARALAPEPAVLLLDEPFSNLDAGLRARLRDDVVGALRDIGAAALMVTHDREEALYLGDRIALMNDGRLLQTGTPNELYHRPAGRTAAAWLGDVNELAATVDGGAVDTALGRLPAPGLADGQPALVCVRSEAIELIAAGAGQPEATVVAVHPLGPVTRVHLRVDGDPGELIAHVPRLVALAPDSRVGLRLDRELAFVFPDDGAL